LPATTPASQAGLLHGASGHVPAFRWYEKETGRLVVTNRPRDSALVEARLSDGRGLLADGGVSVSNVFSGDAPTSLLTMSTAGVRRAAGRPTRYVSAYLLDPFGLTHSLVLTMGEIVKEIHQARRQRVRHIEPRVPRTASYVLLRGATNVLLRHLNLSIIAEHMMRGAPSVYCDFVDYDEIAHHAGPARPEALAALEGIDGVLATMSSWRRRRRGRTTWSSSPTTARARARRSGSATAPVSTTSSAGWRPSASWASWRPARTSKRDGPTCCGPDSSVHRASTHRHPRRRPLPARRPESPRRPPRWRPDTGRGSSWSPPAISAWCTWPANRAG